MIIEKKYDICIVGGGLGGVSGALAAARNNLKVLLIEETDWLGGQTTSQGVPPDEHVYIEKFGRTESYANYRERVRDYYRNNYDLIEEYKMDPLLNPGGGWVGPICHEPKVSAQIFMDMTSKHVSNGNLDILFESNVTEAIVSDGIIEKITVKTPNSILSIDAQYFIDATETGSLLPITNTEYITGSESVEETGELHAVNETSPLDMQAVTWCFAVSMENEGEYIIEKPAKYEYFRDKISEFWPGSQFSWEYSEPHTLNTVAGTIENEINKVDLFGYRKIFDHKKYKNETSSITLVNWPQNDYWHGPIFESDDAYEHYNDAKELSKSFLYWLQTEAGYPNLKPRGDVMGTHDGFAKRPYIRESRRIKAKFRVTEEHIGAKMRKDTKAEHFYDSVGLGHYHLDLHPSTGQRNYIDLESYPFEIPLRALIPIRTKNLLAGAKNIGTTHISNGTYRLHPVEWNIGESAALAIVYCIKNGISPVDIYENEREMTSFQKFIIKEGIQIRWPEKLDKENIKW